MSSSRPTPSAWGSIGRTFVSSRTSKFPEASKPIIRKRVAPAAMAKPATCELFFNHADTRVQEFFIDGSNPPPAFIVANLGDAAARSGRKTRTPNFGQGNGERVEFGGQRHDAEFRAACSRSRRLHRPLRYPWPARSRNPRASAGGARPQLKLDTAKLRGKGAAGSGEIENRDRFRLRAHAGSKRSCVISARSTGTVRQLRYLPRDRRPVARAHRRRSTDRSAGR